MKNRFIASYAFNPDEEGLADFSQYLRTTDNVPARILVDVIEESFSHETIPHVNNVDRKAIVKRLIEKKNRESADYAYFKVIGREISGRRDDNILLSVLTNPGLLAPWLELIEKSGVAISGVWSLPLVSVKLIEKMGLTKGNVLLMTQQVPSNIRQSYYKDGEFKHSRSAGINLYEASIGEYAAQEVDQSIRYLANNRFIGFDEKVNVHIVCTEKDENSIREHCKDSTVVIFHYHYVDEIEELTGCDDIGESFCNGVFSSLCKDEKITRSNYGPKNLFKFYYQQLTETALRAASILIVVTSIILGISFIANTSSIKDEIVVLNENTEAMNKAYQSQLQKLEPELKYSKPMMSTVMLYEKMLESKEIAPQNFMNQASKILTSAGMHDVVLLKIEWQRYQESKKKPLRRSSQKTISMQYVQKGDIKHKAVLTGYIVGSSSDKKSAAEKINSIRDAFATNKQFENVRIVDMSLDMRPEKQVKDESGSEHVSASEDMEDGLFEIELVMKGTSV